MEIVDRGVLFAAVPGGSRRWGAWPTVTPLRDGMNLVAKEYVASQSEEDPGVLVLSRFAGAATELSSALIVNPYDIEGTADAIARGIRMPLDERRERWRDMMDTIRRNDVFNWCSTYLADLAADVSR